MENNKTVFVDVDDTLIRSVGSKIIPNTRVIEKVRMLHQKGMTIIVWSTAGSEYAKRISENIGISEIISFYFTKPQYIIDDQEIDKWLNTKVIHPLQIEEIK